MKYPTATELQIRAKHCKGIPAARFASSYVVESTGCWRWTRARTTAGYGHFWIGDTYYQAHRIAYILHRGPVPADLELDHLCRNRWCINPLHLEIVTRRENIRRGAGTRLNRDLVERIRRAVASGLSQRAVAPLFGIDHSTVSRIVNGSRWGDIRQRVAA
jgi:hypothetical protein